MKLPGTNDKPDSAYTKTATVEINDQGGPELTKAPAVLMSPGQSTAPIHFKAFDIETINLRLEPFKTKIDTLAQMAESFEIKTDADFEQSSEMTGQAKAIAKAIDAAVRAVTDDYYNFYKSGLNMYKALTNVLESRVVGALKPKQNNYSYQKELERREAEKKARDEAAAFQRKLDADAKKKKVAPVAMAPVPVVPAATAPIKTQSGSMSSKMVWDFEFTDFKTKDIFDYVLKVCAGDYIKVAEKAVKKMVKAGMHEGIKGVRFFERAETTHRAR